MEPLMRNGIHTVRIEGYSSDGSGVARLGGMAVFVKGALDGELCEIRLLKVLKTYAFAKIETLIEPSDHRVQPVCANFGKCGGCDFLQMDYAEELRLKKRRVEDALQRIGGLDLSVSEMHGSPARDSYRGKVIYAVGWREGRTVFGFFREHSHDIIPVSRCVIQPEAADRAAAAVCRWADAHGIDPYDEITGSGALRHIFVRQGDGGRIAVCIVSAVSPLPQTGPLVSALRAACPEAVSIVLNHNPARGNTVLGKTNITLWGEDYLVSSLCGLSFRLSPQSFFQINVRQAEILYEKVLDLCALDGSSTAVDLYCGTGTISLVLARKAGHVIGAELVPEAILDAVENARVNKITNAEFICADAAEAALELARRGLKPDAVTLDPPRKGLTPELVRTVADMSPRRIVYVSCDPATLARDLKQFTVLGYLPTHAEAYDMFPRCAHVETCVLMSRVER